MLNKFILSFNVVVFLACLSLAGYGLWVAVVDGSLLVAAGYYLASLFARCAYVDIPEPEPNG